MPNNNSTDIDVSELKLGGSNNSFVKVTGRELSYYLSGEVLDPQEYIEWFDQIRNAGPLDEVTIHINSMGGNMDTALQFVRVLSETQATVITSIEGSCMSAATIIFLQGQILQITPHSLFMIHNYSGGAFGKGGEIYDNIVFERRWSEKLLHWVYKDFLTKEEINSMLDNKDIWMDYEQVAERCTKLVAARKEQVPQVVEIES